MTMKMFGDMPSGFAIVDEIGRGRVVREPVGVLADGSTVPADLIVLAVGVVPNSELAAEADLQACNFDPSAWHKASA